MYKIFARTEINKYRINKEINKYKINTEINK